MKRSIDVRDLIHSEIIGLGNSLGLRLERPDDWTILVELVLVSNWHPLKIAIIDSIDRLPANHSSGAAHVLYYKLLETSEEVNIRRGAGGALAWLCVEAFAQRYAFLLNAPVDTQVQLAAAYAIGLLPRSRTSSRLLLSVASNRSRAEEVRCTAIESLGNLYDTTVVPGLIRLARDPNPNVRFFVYTALGWISDRRALVVLRQAAAVDHDVADAWRGSRLDVVAQEAIDRIVQSTRDPEAGERSLLQLPANARTPRTCDRTDRLA